MDARLSLFYRATHLPVSCIRDRNIVENVHGHRNDFNIPLFLFEGLPEQLPVLWSAKLTEHALFGGVRLQDGSLYILGPAATHELSRSHMFEILRQVGRKAEDLEEMLQYFEHHSICDDDMMAASLCVLSSLLHQPVYEDPVRILYRRSSTLPPAPEFQEEEGADPVMEEALLGAIRHGRPDELRRMLGYHHISAAQKAGTEMPVLMKSYTIGAITLASREAVRGGMDYDLAMKFCTYYIDRLLTAPYAREQTVVFIEAMIVFAEEVRKVLAPLPEDAGLLARRVSQYVQGNLYEKMTPSGIAEALGYTNSYLSTAFRSQTGMTVTELINRQKIEEAKRLLDSRPDSVGEVGTMLGYSSQSYFCTVFRRCTGMTPGQYIAGQKGIRH